MECVQCAIKRNLLKVLQQKRYKRCEHLKATEYVPSYLFLLTPKKAKRPRILYLCPSSGILFTFNLNPEPSVPESKSSVSLLLQKDKKYSYHLMIR